MLKKLRMEQIMSNLWIILILLAMCGFMFYKMGPGLLDLAKGADALTGEKELKDMVGEYVTWTVEYPLGEYVETMTTTKVNGVSTGTKKSRSSWMVIDEEREIILSVEVPAKRYDEMDGQADRFYQALDKDTEITGEGVTVTGTLEVLKGEELGYFKRMADYVGLTADGVVYHIGDEVIHGESKMNTLGISGLGFVLLLIVIIILVKMLKNSPKKFIGQYIERHPGVTIEQLESDFDTAENVNKVWIGNKWTFSSKAGGFLFDNREVIWVHSETVRSGRNVNFYVWWSLIDGSYRSVSLSSEKKCTEVMEKYNRFAHIVIGNNPEYGYMLKNDREKFLDIKYRANSPQ